MKTIEKKYKIKEKYTHLSHFKNETYVKVEDMWYRIIDDNMRRITEYTDEMMEEVDPRFEILAYSHNTIAGTKVLESIHLYKNGKSIGWSKEVIADCEKVLNGEMIDISDMQEVVGDWYEQHSHKLTFSEYLKKIGH